MKITAQYLVRFFAFFNVTISSGKDRLVFIIPFLGMVIKFPKSEKGSRTNFQEWRFWKRKHNIFCQPTFRAFGFKVSNNGKRFWISMQKMGNQICNMDQEQFFIKISMLTKRVSESDGHHFEKPTNFCYDKKGHLKMLDYGDRKTQRVINLFGETIYRDFDKSKIQTFDDLVELIEKFEAIRESVQKHKKI